MCLLRTHHFTCFQQVISYRRISKESGCRKTTNCSRLTTNSTENVRVPNLQDPIFQANPDDINEVLNQFIDSQPGGDLIYHANNLFHARFVSNWWGFPDDLWVEYVCLGEEVGVWIQVSEFDVIDL